MDPGPERTSPHLIEAVRYGTAALCMPPIFGVGTAAVVEAMELGFTGMDSYLPFFQGVLLGCVPGLALGVAAVVHFVRSRGDL